MFPTSGHYFLFSESENKQTHAKKKLTYREMLTEALLSSGRMGMSLQAIAKYIHGKYEADNKTALKKALKKALDEGYLKNKKGHGLVGTFLISVDAKKQLKKENKAANKENRKKPRMGIMNQNKPKKVEYVTVRLPRTKRGKSKMSDQEDTPMRMILRRGPKASSTPNN